MMRVSKKLLISLTSLIIFCGKGTITLSAITEGSATGDSIAIGTSSKTTSDGNISIGKNSKSQGRGSVTIGENAEVSNEVGNETKDGNAGIAIGYGAKVKVKTYGTEGNPDRFASIAIGNSSETTGRNAMAFGYGSKASGSDSISIGVSSKTTGDRSVSLGRRSNAEGDTSLALGVETNAKGNSATAIGYTAKSEGNYSIALGYEAKSKTDSSISIGNSASSVGNKGIAIGFYAKATADDSMAIGESAKAYHKQSVALGYGGATIEDNTISVAYKDPTLAPIKQTILYRKIVGLADGVNDHDAVNVSQLKGLESSLISKTNAFSMTEVKANAGISSAMAMAALPQPTGKGISLGASVGMYMGQTSYALGISGTEGNVRYNINTSLTSKANIGFSAGIGYTFKEKENSKETSEVKSLKSEINSLNETIKQLLNRIEKLEQK